MANSPRTRANLFCGQIFIFVFSTHEKLNGFHLDAFSFKITEFEKGGSTDFGNLSNLVSLSLPLSLTLCRFLSLTDVESIIVNELFGKKKKAASAKVETAKRPRYFYEYLKLGF